MNDADILPMHDAARFLAAIGEPPFLFQTFIEPKAERTNANRRLNQIMLGTFAGLHKRLARLNASGAAVCVMINEGDGTNSRKKDCITRIRCLFVDLDGADVEPVLSGPLRPHIVVETSPGHYHVYWRIADCPLSAFTEAQLHLAAMFGGDEGVSDLSRVMRLPGFDHLKHGRCLSRVTHCEPSPAYTYIEFARAFRFAAPSAPINADPFREGQRNSGLFKLAGGLRRQGIDHEEAARRIAMVNESRCLPPLDSGEVRNIVDNAYTGELAGFMIVPNALLDSPEYKALGPSARNLIDLCYRRYQPDAPDRLVLSFANFRDYFTKSRFHELRNEAKQAGLIIETAPHKQPRQGTKPEAARYRLRYVHRPAGRTIENGE